MSHFQEIVRFRVDPTAEDRFLASRRGVDHALGQFKGFLGSELAKVADDSWVLTVGWADRDSMALAQAVTLAEPGLPELSAWTAIPQQVVSFETAEIRHAFAVDVTQPNLDIALRFVREGLGKADMQVFDELLDLDVVVTTGLSPSGPILGRDAYKAVFSEFANAWPVQELQIDDYFAADDRVMVCFTATALFEKDYFGVSATRVMAPMKEQHCYRLRQGRIVENVVGAINLPFEFIMYPALKDAVVGGLEVRA